MAVKQEAQRAGDFALHQHLNRIGCRSVDAYQEWCLRNGLSTRLRKGAGELRREQELYGRLCAQEALRSARQFDRRPETILREISAGNGVPESYAHRPYLQHLSVLFRSVRKHSRIREEFLRLLLHTHAVADLETTEPVVARYSSFANTFAGGLLALARRYTQWKADPESWKPSSRSARRQFGELARHLFCTYEVPAFLESAWFREGNEKSVAAAQDNYIQIGSGVSLRSMTVPLKLTKRMAHLAMTAVPANCSVEEGWRWAQVIGMGGSERLARAIIGTPIGTQFNEESFWETVVRFFVDQPMLDPSRVGPLIDYLWEERYTPRRGEEPYRLPAQFTMKGRTVAALLERMEAWHRRLAKAATVRSDSWASSGIAGYRQEERPADGGECVWTVEEITTAKVLIAEGHAMQHCVATYAGSCARGAESIWSLRVFDCRTMLEPIRVMTIAVSRNRTITQVRGKRNALPSPQAANSYCRLSKEDTGWLLRGRRVLIQWASSQQLGLPAHLLGD